MKKQLITLIGTVMLAAAVPAIAGPDWQAIEHGRLVKQAEKAAAAKATAAPAAPVTSRTTTSAMDDKMAKMMAECSDVMKKSK